MLTEPPESPVTAAVHTLEVRWILPGQLEAAVARWFGRFPAETDSRQDIYLLDPPLRGLSVKIRGGAALEVKVYRGSPGILEVAGRAHGRMEAWQKWSFALPAQPRQRRPTRLDAGAQEAAHQPVLIGQRADGSARPGAGPAAAVRSGTHRGPHPWPALVDAGLRGDRPRPSSAQRTPGHCRARVRPGPARRGATRHGSIPVLCAVARPAPGRRPNGERQKRLTPPTTPRLSHLVLQEARSRMGFPRELRTQPIRNRPRTSR